MTDRSSLQRPAKLAAWIMVVICCLLVALRVRQSGDPSYHSPVIESFYDVATQKYGYRDKAGKVIIQPEYDGPADIYNSLARVQMNGGGYGFIDKAGRLIVPFKYHCAGDYSNGRAKVGYLLLKDYIDYNKWFKESSCTSIYIDNRGKLINPIDYDNFQNSGEKGFSHRRRTALLNLDTRKYDYIDSYYQDDRIWFREEGKFGFIDTTGKVIVPPKYDRADGFSEGMTAVELDGKWGFVDTSGKVVVPFKYTQASRFSNGRALVGSEFSREKGFSDLKYGYIDKDGREVIPLQFVSAESFSEPWTDRK